jgi:hypothetical protein
VSSDVVRGDVRCHPCDYETCVFDDISCVGTSTRLHGVMSEGSDFHLVTFFLLDGELSRVLTLVCLGVILCLSVCLPCPAIRGFNSGTAGWI